MTQVLALEPRLLLMDEPFASLDAIVRHRITEDLLGWVEREQLTVLLVTHDLEEAQTLSDVVYLLSQGSRARIRERYEVPIPRPRDLVRSRLHPSFGPLLEQLWRAMSREVGGGAEPAHAAQEGVVMWPFEQVWVRQLTALLGFLAGWEALSRTGVLDPFYAPPPTEVARVLITVFAEGTIWPHLQATFTAALLGLLLGLLLGFAGALIPLVAEQLEPVMILLNAIPRVILAPLFVIWLGIGLGSKVALAFVLVAVLIFFAVYGGIREVDKRMRAAAAGRGRVEKHARDPTCTPCAGRSKPAATPSGASSGIWSSRRFPSKTTAARALRSALVRRKQWRVAAWPQR